MCCPPLCHAVIWPKWLNSFIFSCGKINTNVPELFSEFLNSSEFSYLYLHLAHAYWHSSVSNRGISRKKSRVPVNQLLCLIFLCLVGSQQISWEWICHITSQCWSYPTWNNKKKHCLDLFVCCSFVLIWFFFHLPISLNWFKNLVPGEERNVVVWANLHLWQGKLVILGLVLNE